MTLLLDMVEQRIPLTPQRPTTIVVENAPLLVQTITELCNFTEGKHSSASIIDNKSFLIPVTQCQLLMDIFHIDVNSRAVTTALAKQMVAAVNNNVLPFSSIYGDMVARAYDCLLDFDVVVQLNDQYNSSALVKLLDPHVVVDMSDKLIDRLIVYIDVLVQFANLRLLAVFNIRDFLSIAEYNALFEHCRRREVALLQIDSHMQDNYEDQFVLIIDDDLCEIVANQ